MLDNHSKGISYGAGFFILIAFSIAALLLSNEIANPVWKLMTGKTMEVFKTGKIGPEDGDAMKVIQVITAVVGFLFPAVVAAWVLNKKPFQLLGFSTGVKPAQAGLVLLIILTGMIVSSSLAYLNEHIPISPSWRLKFDEMEADYNRHVEVIITLKSVKDYVLALVIMGFLPALCEEALFRGGLQNFLARSTKMPWLAIVIVSIIFSLAHFSFYGFLARFFLGLVLGFIFQYSGKLWLSILAHFINNTLILTIMFAYTQQGKSIKQAMQENTATPWGILAFPVIIALFVLFRKISADKKQAI